MYYEYSGIRRGNWKLVLGGKKMDKKGKTVQGNVAALYDLDADIGEKNDLSKQHPDIAAELKALLDQHEVEVTNNRRPAAVAKDPKPLLSSAEGVPTLAEYLGLSDVQFSAGKKGMEESDSKT